MDPNELANALGINVSTAMSIKDKLSDSIVKTIKNYNAKFGSDQLYSQVNNFVDRWLDAVSKRPAIENVRDKSRIAMILANTSLSPAVLSVLLEPAVETYLNPDEFLKRYISAAVYGKREPIDLYDENKQVDYTQSPFVTKMLSAAIHDTLQEKMSGIVGSVMSSVDSSGKVSATMIDNLLRKEMNNLLENSMQIWDEVINKYARKSTLSYLVVDELTKIANELDSRGLYDLADYVDAILSEGV